MHKIHLYKKQGVIIQKIATELLSLKKGDTLPNISEWQERLKVARGTVQNALNFLKEQQAITIQAKGRLGTVISTIDYRLLQEFSLTENIMGTMTLPYSIAYEGLATGLFDVFQNNDIKMNLAYIRGSKERIQSIVNETFQFAIVSRFAAKEAIKNGNSIEIIMDFGNYSYLSKHALVFSKGYKKIDDGMKIGIDFSSLDHHLLTKEITQHYKVELVDILGYQMLPFIIEGKIDAGVWNIDEVETKYHNVLHYETIEGGTEIKDMTAAVIICNKSNEAIKTIFKKLIKKDEILRIQQLVKLGTLMPRY